MVQPIAAQEPAFYHVSTAEGLNDNSVNDVKRDRNGILSTRIISTPTPIWQVAIFWKLNVIGTTTSGCEHPPI